MMKGHIRESERTIATGVTWKRRRRNRSFLEYFGIFGVFIFFAVSLMYMEFIFHIRFFDKISAKIILAMLFSACLSIIPAIICALLPAKASKVTAIIFQLILTVLFGAQAVYYQVFKTFLSVYSIGNGGQALQFWREILSAIAAQWFTLLLLFLPLLFLCIFGRKLIYFGKFGWHIPAIFALAAVIFHIILLGVMRLYGTELYSPYDLYFKNKVTDLSMDSLGVMTTMRLDLKALIFGDGGKSGIELDTVDTKSGESTSETQEPPTSGGVVVIPGHSGTNPSIDDVIDYVVDTSPNIINIDFATLAANEKNSTVATVHNYFAGVTPTNKNEYTGMFKGYNLIKITAEGFNTFAVNEQITPTLYKLSHSGFVFNNFYNPVWGVSTTDGEYVACLGLIPKSGTWSFREMGLHSNSLPFAMGNMMTALGYSTYAYHNHTFSYYYRNLSHPIMGYNYKGYGNGLNVKKTWPESDLEMIELTVPEYIDKTPFHAYYMTVSGHLNYNFRGNMMAYKNRAAVQELDYSEECRAYLACQIELDKALEKLIDELDRAGLLENTVIVLSGDHYPYGLSDESINEFAGHEVERNFELYKSTLIMWSASMKETVEVDKVCCSMDIMPTLCNLFGIEYDSRMYMGKDILSDSEPLVVFSNRSFITDKVMYNSKTGSVINLTGEDLPDKYVSNMKAVVSNQFKISKAILETNYYSYIEEYTPYGKDKAINPEKYDFPITYKE